MFCHRDRLSTFPLQRGQTRNSWVVEPVPDRLRGKGRTWRQRQLTVSDNRGSYSDRRSLRPLPGDGICRAVNVEHFPRNRRFLFPSFLPRHGCKHRLERSERVIQAVLGPYSRKRGNRAAHFFRRCILLIRYTRSIKVARINRSFPRHCSPTGSPSGNGGSPPSKEEATGVLE